MLAELKVYSEGRCSLLPVWASKAEKLSNLGTPSTSTPSALARPQPMSWFLPCTAKVMVLRQLTWRKEFKSQCLLCWVRCKCTGEDRSLM